MHNKELTIYQKVLIWFGGLVLAFIIIGSGYLENQIYLPQLLPWGIAGVVAYVVASLIFLYEVPLGVWGITSWLATVVVLFTFGAVSGMYRVLSWLLN